MLSLCHVHVCIQVYIRARSSQYAFNSISSTSLLYGRVPNFQTNLNKDYSMPKLHLDRDPVTLQDGNHIAAQVGDKMLRPDTMEYISGDIDHITVYRPENSSLQLNCTRDVEFLPGEQVVLQQLGKHHGRICKRTVID